MDSKRKGVELVYLKFMNFPFILKSARKLSRAYFSTQTGSREIVH